MKSYNSLCKCCLKWDISNYSFNNTNNNQNRDSYLTSYYNQNFILNLLHLDNINHDFFNKFISYLIYEIDDISTLLNIGDQYTPNNNNHEIDDDISFYISLKSSILLNQPILKTDLNGLLFNDQSNTSKDSIINHGSDYIICADGGANRFIDSLNNDFNIEKDSEILSSLSKSINAIIGDLDSVKSDIIDIYLKNNRTIILKSNDQNTNDLQKSIIHLTDIQNYLNFIGKSDLLDIKISKLNSLELLLSLRIKSITDYNSIEKEFNYIIDINNLNSQLLYSLNQNQNQKNEENICKCSCHNNNDNNFENDLLSILNNKDDSIIINNIKFCFDKIDIIGGIGGRFDHEINSISTSYKLNLELGFIDYENNKDETNNNNKDMNILKSFFNDFKSNKIQPIELIIARFDFNNQRMFRGPWFDLDTKFFNLINDINENQNNGLLINSSSSIKILKDYKFLTHLYTNSKLIESFIHLFKETDYDIDLNVKDSFHTIKLNYFTSNKEIINDFLNFQFGKQIFNIGSHSCVLTLLHQPHYNFHYIINNKVSKDNPNNTCSLIPFFKGSANLITSGLKWDLNLDLPLDYTGLVSTSNQFSPLPSDDEPSFTTHLAIIKTFDPIIFSFER